ncbi:MAG: hypothetical protein Q8L37_04490 [Candidatus Gottesmanbacteria bacterium]|nr:hypothetical protein [Candidatus Gottesmanbacteria bacterium]
MIYFELKNETGEIILRNTDTSFLYNQFKKKEIGYPGGRLVLYSNDEDLLRSNKVFGKVGTAVASFIESINNHFLKQIEVHLHTLKKIHAQLLQKIESIVPNPLLMSAPTYGAQSALVLEKVKSQPEQVTEYLLFLKKRIYELGAHMYSFEILHMGKLLHIDKKSHNIKQLILGVWHGFDDETNKRGLTCQFMFEDKIADDNRIVLDYKTINAALYNFFDNAIKYMKPHSHIRFYMEVNEGAFSLVAQMYSLRIESYELTKVFELGYRGASVAKSEEGTGVGMYIVKKAFDLNGLTVCIVPDFSKAENISGKQYILNRFIIKGIVSGY